MSWLPRHSILAPRERRKGVPGKRKRRTRLRRGFGVAGAHLSRCSASEGGTFNAQCRIQTLPLRTRLRTRLRRGMQRPLQFNPVWQAANQKLALPRLQEFNGHMKIKMLAVAAFAGCVLGCTASLQTTTIKGTVCSCTATQVTVLEDDNKNYYDIIQLTATTIIDPPVTPPCKAGTPVTVTCKPTDAQRKENPAGGCPTPTPTPPPA